MRYRLRLLIAVVAVSQLTGCEPPKGDAGSLNAGKTPSPTTRPTTQARTPAAPTTKPAMKPLSARALVALDKLKPAVSKPARAPDSAVPPRAQKAVGKAKKLIDDGKYALAVPLLVERALGFAPNSAEVHRLLGEAYLNLPDAGKALVHMQKAVKLDGDSIAAQLKLARLFDVQKQRDKAIIALRTALVCSQSKPENPLTGETLFRLGQLLDQGGYWRAALDCFETLGVNIETHGRKYASRPVLRNIVLRPQRLLNTRGELLVKLRQPAKAAPLLKRAFARDRTNVKLAGLLVESLVASGRFKEAETFLVDLAGQPSLQAKLPALAADIAIGSGDKAMPMRIWKACQAAKRGSGDLAVALAEAAKKLGAPDQASAILQSVMDSKPGDVAVTKFIVAMYASQGKGDMVLSSLAKLLRADPGRDDIVDDQLASLDSTGLAKDFARKFAGTIGSAPTDERASLHYLTGRLARLQGDKSLPLEQYIKAVGADPTFLPTYGPLAEIYGKKGDKDKLAGLLKKLDKLPGGQESVASYYARGKVYLAMSNAPQAEEMLLKGRELDRRHVPTLEALGDALLMGGRGEAVAAYRLVFQLAPKRRGLRKRLFEAYMAMKSFREAKKIADEILRQAPKSRDAKIMLARVLVASGQNTQAAKLLAELKAGSSDNRALRFMAIKVSLAGTTPVMFKKDFDKAVNVLEKLTGSDSSDKDALFALATLMTQNGQYDRAVKLWDELLKIRDDHIVRRVRIGTLMAAGTYDVAASEIRKIVTVMPNDTILQDKLFMCLQLDGQNDQAYALMKQRLSKATDAEQAISLRFDMINFLRSAKLYDRSQKFMDDWILVNPRLGQQILGWKMETYLLSKQYPQGIAYAEKLLARSARNHQVKLLLAAMLTKTKAYDKAHALLDKWIAQQRKKPDNTQVGSLTGLPISPGQMIGDFQGLKAGAYADAGKFEQADAYVSACIKKDPGNFNVHVGFISVLKEAKLYDQAVTRLDAWIKKLSEKPNAATKPGATTRPVSTTRPGATTRPAPTTRPVVTAAVTEGMLKSFREEVLAVLLLKKDYAQAAKRADEYIKADPKNVNLLVARASALNESKQPDKALVDMRKTYKLSPNIPLYWNNLGYQLADMGLDLIEAEKLIKGSLATIKPSSVNYVPPLDSLAWVLYKQGKLHRAGTVFLDVIRRSREKKYIHPILFDHAGDGFYRLGWTEKAIELWTKALKVAADDETEAREVLNVKRDTPKKIKSAKAGKPVQVAPLGKGMKIQDK
jgi:tetratricopeptide (TPR) repeat protein